VKPVSFLCYHGLISVRIREVPFHLLRYWVLRRARHQSAPPVAPVSWPCLPRAHKQLIFFDYSALGSHSARVTQGCLDSFFPLCLIWCMLLIRFCLAQGFTQAASRAHLALISLAVSCCLPLRFELLILCYLFCCGLLQGEAGIVLQLPDKKLEVFKFQSLLNGCFLNVSTRCSVKYL
jgi:hypothetical protein